jgi:hypothetical protein
MSSVSPVSAITVTYASAGAVVVLDGGSAWDFTRNPHCCGDSEWPCAMNDSTAGVRARHGVGRREAALDVERLPALAPLLPPAPTTT